MPLYEYQCEACGKRFEVIRKFSDPPLDTCRLCGKSPVQRLFSSPAIQFKGSGWYITDYSQKGKSGGEAPSSEPGSAKAADAKKNDGKKSESGSETTGASSSTSATKSSPPEK